MKLLLVCPSVHQDILKRVTPFWLPPLNLAIIAGITPEDWDVKIVDENVEDINFDGDYNLVGISTMTANSYRAYEIAKQFKIRGFTVVIGGAHASVCPEEVIEHADTVVIGDAEPVWETLLNDFKANKLQRIYRADVKKMICSFGKPKRELYNKEKYLSVNTIQTSKGCPFKCSFCSIASRFGGKYGVKPVSDVIEEVGELADRNMPVFFVDDNFLVNKKRSKEILNALKTMNVKWWSQADINIMKDREMLELMHESGCIKVVVGFETISEGSLETIQKYQNNLENYVDFIKTLHNHGVLVNTSFAFGTEHDREDVFEKTYKFLVDNEVIFATFNILTPLPGTEMYQQFRKENKLIDKNWSHYDMGHPVFQPTHLSTEQLKEGYNWICDEFYSFQEISKRVSTLKRNPHTFDIGLILGWNMGYKKLLDTFGVFM
jgi:radical SAM superfamily enzyme YgiQ (UPF0313 family)